MSVVDEKSGISKLQATALPRVAEALDREPVACVFLFGSHARGSAGPLSDVDLAVVPDDGVERSAANKLHLELTRAAAEALGSSEVDVVIVNRASPLLRHRVARDGRLLVDRDPRARVRFVAQALRDYLDTQPLRDEQRRGIRRRIEEDRFGRP